jgi:hypothetical protein
MSAPAKALPTPHELSWAEAARAYGALLVRSLRAAFAYRSSTVQSFLTALLTFYVIWLVWAQVYTATCVPRPRAGTAFRLPHPGVLHELQPHPQR